MNLFELFVKIGVDDQASNNLSKITDKLGNGLKKAAQIGTAAVSAATAGIAALTKAAVDNYAEYEQLVGGAELMFGGAFKTVEKNAQEAYETVQMSQSEYLKQVNGFATGLKTALGGNEEAAADLAHKIVKAEADIIAATGNTAENVQNAFNGIMRSNFTMLDNLQIGITPTKEGFQELIDKVNEWNETNGKATSYQLGNLADMQSALIDYIDMVGYSGYASAEAAGTISGSVASMRSAWRNLLVGFADETQDLGSLVDRFVLSFDTALDNLLPRIEIALDGVAMFLEKFVPKIAEALVPMIAEYAPKLITIGTELTKSLATGVFKAISNLEVRNKIFETVKKIASMLITRKVEMVKAAISFVKSLADGLVDNFDEIVPKAKEFIGELVSFVSENASDFLDAANSIITAISYGIVEHAPNIIGGIQRLVSKIGVYISENTQSARSGINSFIEKIVKFFTDAESREQFTTAAINIIVGLVAAISTNAIKMIPAAVALISELAVAITNPEIFKQLTTLATNVIAGIANAIVSILSNNEMIETLVNSAGEILLSLVDAIVKSLPTLLTAAVKIIENLITFLLNDDNTEKIVQAAIDIIMAMSNALSNNAGEILSGVGNLIFKIIEAFFKVDWGEIGKKIGGSLLRGLLDVFGALNRFDRMEINPFEYLNPQDYIPKDITNLLPPKEEEEATVQTPSLEYLHPWERTQKYPIIVQNIYSQSQTAADLAEETQWEAYRTWMTQKE